jgi:hypothetical protein
MIFGQLVIKRGKYMADVFDLDTTLGCKCPDVSFLGILEGDIALLWLIKDLAVSHQ